jgi:DNA-binding protein H-NS
MYQMDNFLKLVTNRNSLKSLTKDFYIDELQKFSSNLAIIIEQRDEQEDKLREKHNKKIQKIKAQLDEEGISIDDLMGNSPNNTIKPKKARKKIPAKYRLVDLEGVTHEWTGRGLAPKVFKLYFESGHTKDSCLIIDSVEV